MYFKTYNVCFEKCLVLQPCFLTQPENEREKNKIITQALRSFFRRRLSEENFRSWLILAKYS